jgi:hypothetical protein
VRTIHVPEDAVGKSLTRDGRCLLVADGVDGATVVSVARAESAARADGFRTSRYLGSVPLGRAAVGLAVSPDGRWL